MIRDEFIGRAWFQPPDLPRRAQAAQLHIARLEDNITQSLENLFETLPGQRIAHPLYGCDLNQYVFRSISNSLIAEMKHTIETAITLFEPRVQLAEIDIAVVESNTLSIQVGYAISETNSRYNLVIPFSLEGGVTIP